MTDLLMTSESPGACTYALFGEWTEYGVYSQPKCNVQI